MRTAIRDVAEGADMGLETGSVPGLSCSLYGGVDFGEDYREVTGFLEVLRNLEQLKKDVFFMSYSPLPILGLDSSPVRAYAIEGLAEFSE